MLFTVFVFIPFLNISCTSLKYFIVLDFKVNLLHLQNLTLYCL